MLDVQYCTNGAQLRGALLGCNSQLLAEQANTKETTNMLKQLLTGGSIRAFLQAGSLSAKSETERTVAADSIARTTIYCPSTLRLN